MTRREKLAGKLQTAVMTRLGMQSGFSWVVRRSQNPFRTGNRKIPAQFFRTLILAVAMPVGIATAQNTPRQEPPLPRVNVPQPTEAVITVRDIRTRTYIVADDGMQGRDTGKSGGLKSANYIAGELKRMGLEPAGDNGTFLQQIPWVNLRPNPESELVLGESKFKAGIDFLLVPRVGLQVFLNGQPYGATFKGSKIPTVYGGRIGDSAIAPAAVAGKVVVFAMPTDRPAFAFWQRDNLRRYKDAAAILVATLDLGAPNQDRQPRDTYWDSTWRAEAKPMTVISISNGMADRIFGRRLASTEVGATGEPLSGQVDYIISQTEAPSYNVVGIVRGTDAKRRNSYVSVGMHHDHIGFSRPVDHDSIRAFNSVVRVRGADDPMPFNVSEDQWKKIRERMEAIRKQ